MKFECFIEVFLHRLGVSPYNFNTINLLRFYLLRKMADLTHAQWKKGAMLHTGVGLLYRSLFCDGNT